MGQAKPTLPQPGDSKLRSVVNTAFSTIQTATGAVTGDNIREEGLDEFSMAQQSAVQAYVAEDTATTLSNTAYALLVLGGNNVETGAFTVAAGEFARVRAEFQCVNDPAGVGPTGVPAGHYVQGRLRKTIATVGSFVTGTERTTNDQDTGVVTMDCLLPPAVYDKIQVYTRIDSAGQYIVGYASIIVELFRKVT